MTTVISAKELARLARKAIGPEGLERALGLDGTPRQNGEILTEHNSHYEPVEAIGSGEPGTYRQYSKHAMAASPLDRRTKDLASAGWQLSLPPMPEYLKGNSLAKVVRKVQWEAQQRLWARWTTPSEVDPFILPNWLRQATQTTPIDGCAPYELVAEEEVVTFQADGLARRILFPTLPQYRSPYNLEAWLTHKGKWVGCLFRYDNVSDYTGSLEGADLVLIPATKMVLSVRNRIGLDLNGQSEMRPIGNLIELSWALHEVEALGLERHASGELMVTPKNGASLADDDKKRIKAYLSDRAEGRKVAGMLLPTDVDHSLISPQNAMPDFSPTLSRLHEGMLQSLGSEHRSMAAGGGPGSYAARQSASEEANRERDDDAAQFALEPLQTTMVRMLQWSGLDVGGLLFPARIVSRPLNQRLTAGETIEHAAKAVKEGMLQWTPADEKRLRALLDLEVNDD